MYDINGTRASFPGEHLHVELPAYTDFDLMLKEQQPDVVIVTTKDCAHAQSIVKALEFGCDVITDKPMTTTAEMCAGIIEAENRTGHMVTVTFNCRTCPQANTCEYYIDITKEEGGLLQYVDADCESEDGYIRDRCLFSDVIDIKDGVSVNVKYRKGAVMSYWLTAHTPHECMRIVINGTKGRLEGDTAFGKETLKIYNRDGECVNYDRSHVRQLPGGHGGSAPALRNNLFRGYAEDSLHQMADTRGGAMSIGIAANKSMAEDRVVYLSEFLSDCYSEIKPEK